jgi:hypothetical protein
MTTPGNDPRDKSRPDNRAPELSRPGRSGSLPPQSHGPPPLPKPVLPLDYAGPDARIKPSRWLLVGSIVCGTAGVVAAVVSFVYVFRAIRGPNDVYYALAVGLAVLGAYMLGMVRVFGSDRTAKGIAIGLLIVMLIGCAGLAVTCGQSSGPD